MPRRSGEDIIPPRTIAVRVQSYRGEFGPVVGARKRFISLPEALYSILQQLKHRRTSTAPEDFVLVSRSGTSIYPDNVAARRLKWIGRVLDMPWLSWNVFQRTRVNLMAQFGRHLHKELENALPLRPRVDPSSFTRFARGQRRKEINGLTITGASLLA